MAQSVRRAIEVLFFVAEEPAGSSLANISRSLGLNKATAYRLASTLVDCTLLRQDSSTRRYFAGDGLLRLAGSPETTDQVRAQALRYMEELRDRTRETVCLVVAKGLLRVTIEVLPALHELCLVPELHSTRPLYVGAPGKALLAHYAKTELDRVVRETGLARVAPGTITSPVALARDLAKVRRLGYAVSVEETNVGGAAVAAPIFNFKGEVCAAVNVHGPRFRFGPAVLKEYGELAADAARRISTDLGAPPRKLPGSGGSPQRMKSA